MTIRYSKLKGMELLAEHEGALAGNVRWVLIDSQRKQAVALVCKRRGVSGENLVKVSDVTRVGRDVVFVKSLEALRQGLPGGRDVRDLLGLSVTSLDGKRLGVLDDLVFSCESWKITAVVLEGGAEVDLAAEAVLGEDTILLQKGAQDQVRRPRAAAGGKGFLDRVFGGEAVAEATAEPQPKAKKKTARRRKSAKRQ